MTLIDQANTLAQTGRLREALSLYAQILAQEPGNMQVWNNQGIVLDDLGQYDAAIDSFNRAIALNSNYAQAHCNKGVVLDKLTRWEEAVACFDLSIASTPNFATAYSNRGNPLRSLHRYEEALASYRRAVELEPAYVTAHCNESTCRLHMGDYALGWQKFEWRWDSDSPNHQVQNTPKPTWRGETSPQGLRIVVWPEGGFGDIFLFSRLALLLQQQGALVTLAVPASLVKLYQSSQLPFDILSIYDGMQMPDCDNHTSILSLPYACKINSLDKVPVPVPYLHSSLELTAMWHQKLANLSQSTSRIGLCWAGDPTRSCDAGRSLRFDQLNPIIQTASHFGIQVFSLQKGHAATQINNTQTVIDLSNELTDWSETAAAISNLDLIITTCTAIAHLAGAMGKPTWVLLGYNAYWLWLADRTDSPWYPSVRLFRQPTFGDWDTVMSNVTSTLTACCAPNLPQ